jgi:hypothetical protein
MRNAETGNYGTAIVRGAAIGTGIGAWIAGWVLGLLILLQRGFLNLGVQIPEQYKSSLAIPPEDILHSLWTAFRVPMPTNSILLAVLLIAVGAAVGFSLAVLALAISLDRRSIGRSSFVWGLRGMMDWRAVLVCGAPLLVAAIDSSCGNLFTMVTLLVMVAFASIYLPVAVCRMEVAAHPRPAKWWVLRWPGTSRVLWFLAIEVVVVALGFTEALLSGSAPTIQWTAGIVAASVSFVSPLFQGIVLTTEAPLSVGRLRRILTWRCFGPWIAYNTWLCIAVLFLLAPSLSACYWLWKVVPALANIASSQGAVIPLPGRLVIAGFHFLGKYGWALFPLPLTFLYWLGTARYLFEVREWLGDLSGGDSEFSAVKRGAIMMSAPCLIGGSKRP